jgi:hypothetical protein
MSRIPHYGRFFGRVETFVTGEMVEPITAEAATIGVDVQADGVAVEVFVDWRSLSWPQLRSLAASLTDDPIRNREDAERAVKAKYGN